MSTLDSADVWERILDPGFAPMLEELTATPGPLAPAVIDRLRRAHSREEVAVAIELIAARRRAERKFASPEQLLCDLEGVAQASGDAIAAHKAQRFAAAPRILDLCSGIGGDAIAFRRIHPAVTAVDASPARAVMTRHNAAVEVVVGDVADQDVGGAWIHIDPSRRTGAARVWRYADCQPGPDVVESLLDAAAGGALKLGPGVDWAEIERSDERECEVIGDRSGLLQTVVWCGALARTPGQRTATRLHPDGAAQTWTAEPHDDITVAAAAGRYLVLPERALERTQLVGPRIGERAIHELAPGLGWFTADEPVEDPWFETHEILCRMSWRPKRIKAWLAANDGGGVVVRTRARAVETDRVQRELRGKGATPYTVFGVREGKQIVCYVTPGAMG